MAGNVVPLRTLQEPLPDGFSRRLSSVIAILRAIDEGELLAALPDCDIANANHRTALTLLDLAERELTCLYEECLSDPRA